MQKVNKKFYVGAWLIGMLAHWFVWVLVSVLRIYYPDNPAVGMIMLPASWFTLLAVIAALTDMATTDNTTSFQYGRE